MFSLNTFEAHALFPHCVRKRLTLTGRSSPLLPGHHGNLESDTQPGSEVFWMKMTKVCIFF